MLELKLNPQKETPWTLKELGLSGKERWKDSGLPENRNSSIGKLERKKGANIVNCLELSRKLGLPSKAKVSNPGLRPL